MVSRVKGQKAEKVLGWGLSPLGTQPEEPKGDQVGSSPPAKTQRELALCPAFPKVFCPSLPLGTPGTPSCMALPVLAPTPTQPHLLQNRIFQMPAQSY